MDQRFSQSPIRARRWRQQNSRHQIQLRRGTSHSLSRGLEAHRAYATMGSPRVLEHLGFLAAFFQSRISRRPCRAELYSRENSSYELLLTFSIPVLQEDWSFTKQLARWSALWLIISWALGCAFASQPRVLMDDIFLYGVESSTTLLSMATNVIQIATAFSVPVMCVPSCHP